MIGRCCARLLRADGRGYLLGSSLAVAFAVAATVAAIQFFEEADRHDLRRLREMQLEAVRQGVELRSSPILTETIEAMSIERELRVHWTLAIIGAAVAVAFAVHAGLTWKRLRGAEEPPSIIRQFGGMSLIIGVSGAVVGTLMGLSITLLGNPWVDESAFAWPALGKCLVTLIGTLVGTTLAGWLPTLVQTLKRTSTHACERTLSDADETPGRVLE